MRRAAAAALVLVALAACTDTAIEREAARWRDVEPERRVLVIGDSNLFNSIQPVDAALRDAGFEPTLHGVPGYGVKDYDDYWRTEVPELLEVDPSIVVVGLGTNDTISTEHVFLVPLRIDQMMETIGERPVIWLTHVDDRPGAEAAAGVTVNRAIRDAAERWPNLVVLDFTEVIAEEPGVLAADRLHFTDRGARVYAESITEAVVELFELCSEQPDTGCV